MNISDFLVNTCVKQSKFNIKVDLNGVDQDSVYIFNSFSGSFISIRKAVSDYFSLLNYKEIDVNTIDKEYMDYLVSLLEGNFLLDKHIDEIQLLKYLYNKGRFVSNYLNITIIPTLDCNLNCPYCYQHKEDRSVMSQVIQDKIIDFIKSKISNKISSIHVAWYGGEPLLCVNIIDNLSVKIMQLAQEARDSTTISDIMVR